MLVVTPPPGQLHQPVGAELFLQLVRSAPSPWRVVYEWPLPLGTDGRVPDLAVVRDDAPLRVSGPYPAGPEHVGLVVEIVSPSSRKTSSPSRGSTPRRRSPCSGAWRPNRASSCTPSRCRTVRTSRRLRRRPVSCRCHGGGLPSTCPASPRAERTRSSGHQPDRLDGRESSTGWHLCGRCLSEVAATVAARPLRSPGCARCATAPT
ncbi:MAG: Uma2 family endonuclease [Actinobacteria bacterium]|nr:Uma2 family endonuclease [Actinomycetota bacterium]MBW3648101.1 Uma2 family endonuclease [Actinomycetota bacterium]